MDRRCRGTHYYVRQFEDMKGSIEIDGAPVSMVRRYASICGWTLARAHARSGDPAAIAGYLGRSDRFDRAIGDFSVAYADQNEREYDAHHGHSAAGRFQREGLKERDEVGRGRAAENSL